MSKDDWFSTSHIHDSNGNGEEENIKDPHLGGSKGSRQNGSYGLNWYKVTLTGGLPTPTRRLSCALGRARKCFL